MSVTAVPLRPIAKGSLTKLWLAVAALIAIAFAIAWMGTAHLRPEVTASGIEFKTVKAGQGPFVQQQDAVLIDYVGKLDDGTVFDSSEGQPRPFTPMATVPGFAEAMLKMQKGGQYSFRLPPELGYGQNSPPGIPANSALNFDVTVAEVGPGMGPVLLQQMMQQQAPQPEGAAQPGQ